MCFGSMFPKLPRFRFSDQDAADLVATMEDQHTDPPGVDQGTHDDSSTLPSEYTYLGQFVDHNLDFDETNEPTVPLNANTLTNYESFRFDLNNVFGAGPTVDPQLYGPNNVLLVQGTLGTPQADGAPTVTNGNPNGMFDLDRNAQGVADLVEPRDDENQIISQIHAAFVAFYNDFVAKGDSYQQARQLTEDYYQEIVLTDLLPAYVGQDTINKYLTHNSHRGYSLSTPQFPQASFTPIEFSVGAYRFGHSLVRQIYHINDIEPEIGDDDNNVPIFDLPVFQTGDLTGGGQLPGSTTADPAGHQIFWRYFIPAINAEQEADGLPATEVNDASPNGDTGDNYARKTQTSVVPALFNLPASTIAGCTDAADPVCNGSGVLLSRDFARGNYDGLASGQAIAKALGCPVISARSINPTKDQVFNTATPLLYYVLAEAQQANKTLGCVGSSIIAQTFLRALWDTPNSILQNGFKPDPALVQIHPEAEQPGFSLGDLMVDVGLAPRSS
jgi:Animal haem peroxidase